MALKAPQTEKIVEIEAYENEVFTTEDECTVSIDEVSRRWNPETKRYPISVTVNLSTLYIKGLTLNDVTLVTEFPSRDEASFYLTQIEKGIVSSADIAFVYANTTQDPDKTVAELIRDNSDLGMLAEA